MRKRPPVNQIVGDPSIDQLPELFRGWMRDGKGRGHSPRTVEERELVFGKLLWFLKDRQHPHCGEVELEEFFGYVDQGHTDPRGRWGNPRYTKPVRPNTRLAYFRVCRAFFSFLERRGRLDSYLMDGMEPPAARQDQIQPFSEAQVEALLSAAKTGTSPLRDRALILLLLDTGIRVSEVVGLTAANIDLDGFEARVLGKGNIERTVPFGRKVSRALNDYLDAFPRRDEQSLFFALRGTSPGEPLTRSGVGQIIDRLGEAAGVTGVRCSPHTFRHTFAVTFLRNGGDVFTLKAILGHTSLAITQKYLLLAQADVHTKHRAHSPADQLGKARRERR